MSNNEVPCLRLGRHWVDLETARMWVGSYVSGGGDKLLAYPAYDAYRADDRFEPLDDADLLAPVLLEVTPSLEAYYWLSSQLNALNRALRRIPAEAMLAGTRTDLDLLAPLFAVLDDESRSGVFVTTLAKVLHRKRPGFIPLYDTNVGNCYTTGPGVPLPRDPNRRYSDFIVALAGEMRADLQLNVPAWQSLADLAHPAPITELRALDIVAWNVGQCPEAACIGHDHAPGAALERQHLHAATAKVAQNQP